MNSRIPFPVATVPIAGLRRWLVHLGMKIRKTRAGPNAIDDPVDHTVGRVRDPFDIGHSDLARRRKGRRRPAFAA